MITLTTLSLLNIAHQLSLGSGNDLYNASSFYMSIFMVCMIPSFVLIGTALIFSKVEDRNKLILVPIFGALIPICFSMPFS